MLGRKKNVILPFYILFLILFTPILGLSQEKNEENLLIIDQRGIQKMSVDALGNLYLISESSLYKYDLSGKLLYSYANYNYGPIHAISVNNHLKIMLFFKETGKIVFLNDRLTTIGTEFDLFISNFYNITLAAYSINNQLWLYDQSNSTLEIRDSHFSPVSRVIYNFDDFAPSQLLQMPNQNFLMLNPDQAIYLFDAFGTLIKTLPLQTQCEVQVIGNSIYYIRDSRIEKYNHAELRHEILDRDVAGVQQFLIFGEKIVLLTNGTVAIRQIAPK
ncbi:hypothetical protein LJC53_00925 [Bacteroidales bacterium OttesenSCG-928-C03]|nr:hypothetical protein [Bacteroidales bacterium OttesenSCG-928-E04]MDL2308132.1 hypothetical protein [Bacteroidales bacterium OttesenSCG-928-C03]MDL2325558.1 hypothetical protein [Bacteroidales bacterium OttesenSCG-928-A14]